MPAQWVTIKGKRFLKFRCLVCGKEWMIDESTFDFLTSEKGLNMELEDILYCPEHWNPKRKAVEL